MKQYRIALLAIMIVLFMATTLLAQPARRTPEERAKQMKEQLTLNDKQVKQLTEIYADVDKKREAMFQDMDGDREMMREKMMKMNDETDAKIEKILNKDQKKKYEEVKKERRQGMGGRGERKMQ